MKIITYLAFTVLSIAMQFVVMDFIQEKIKANDDNKIDLNVTSPKKRFKDILQQYVDKPHALYYRYPDGHLERSALKAFTNSSIQEITLESSTDLSSTMDILYDDNVTTTEDTFTEPTDSVYSSTEFDNVTEITLFEKKNGTEVKMVPKNTVSKDCNCNLLYKVCDINCCCDSDCTEANRKMFVCTTSALDVQGDQSCHSPFPYSTYSVGANIEALFCVAKSNLPDKRNIVHNKHDPSVLIKTFKWHESSKPKKVLEFTKTHYKYDDPIWLLRNGSIYYVDMPTTLMNNYCNGRKPLRFLKQENTKCNVKLSDLEILQILGTVEETSVISVIENTSNTSTLNCSTLHCTNWTVNLCDEAVCTKYNKSLHDPLCTENLCTHLALKVDYIFHYYEKRIMNATVTLHTQRVPLNIPFIEQEINVKFVIANDSVDQIVEFSGSPGYIVGLPIIVSYFEGNYTHNFFKDSANSKKYILYPKNENGACNSNTNNFIQFGTNKRMKCRYYQQLTLQKKNGTELCQNIQNGINRLLGTQNKIAVSPLGNPSDINDENWIDLKIDTPETLLYGQLETRKARLNCFNLITRFSFIFTFSDTSDGTTKSKNTILSARVGVTPANVTVSVDAASVVLTLDTSFMDERAPGPGLVQYAGGPRLNIYLPRDFFFPFPSTANPSYACNVYLLLVCVSLLIDK